MWISEEQAVPRRNAIYAYDLGISRGKCRECFAVLGREGEAVGAKSTSRASGKNCPYCSPAKATGLHPLFLGQADCQKTKAPKGWTINPSQTPRGARQSEVLC